MEEMRKQFENWAGHRYGEDDLSFSSEDETYDSWLVQDAWEAWQASRAALAVELPEPFKLAKASSGLTYYYEDEVDKALRAAGITVKGEGDG